MLRLLEDDADAMKHIVVLTIYKISLIYIYVVRLLVWIRKCTRCTVRTLKPEAVTTV
jgi:hypothetical protein